MKDCCKKYEEDCCKKKDEMKDYYKEIGEDCYKEQKVVEVVGYYKSYAIRDDCDIAEHNYWNFEDIHFERLYNF